MVVVGESALRDKEAKKNENRSNHEGGCNEFRKQKHRSNRRYNGVKVEEEPNARNFNFRKSPLPKGVCSKRGEENAVEYPKHRLVGNSRNPVGLIHRFGVRKREKDNGANSKRVEDQNHRIIDSQELLTHNLVRNKGKGGEENEQIANGGEGYFQKILSNDHPDAKRPEKGAKKKSSSELFFEEYVRGKNGKDGNCGNKDTCV